MNANPSLRRNLRNLRLRLNKALENPTPLLNVIGGLLMAQTGQAFDQSALGDWVWPKRYPNQGDGDRFVNIAGIVSDFTRGKEPPLRRFESRPPLLDEGWLRRTMKDKSRSMAILGSHTVEVGTTDPNAAKHQWGGQSEQFITDTVRDNCKKWLNGGPSWTRHKTTTKRGEIDLGIFGKHKWEKKTTKSFQPTVYTPKADRGTGYIGTLTRRERYGSILSFIFRNRVLITHINQRPFVGISDEYREKIMHATEDFFNGKATVRVVN